MLMSTPASVGRWPLSMSLSSLKSERGEGEWRRELGRESGREQEIDPEDTQRRTLLYGIYL